MGLFDLLFGWRRTHEPTLFALYHEARHEWHGRATSLGSALVAFSTDDQAKSYACVRDLRGFLPAPITPATLVRHFEEFVAQGFHSFLLDLGLDETTGYVGIFPFGEPSSRRAQRLLTQVLRSARRVHRRAARNARRRGRGNEGRREYNLGCDARSRLRFAEAIGRFRRVTDLEASLAPRAHIELGEIYRFQSRYHIARQHYMTALKELGNSSRPEASRALAGLGYCMVNQGEHEDALNAFRDAWRRSPDVPAHGLRLARMLTHFRRTDEAAEVLEQLRDDHPADVEVLDEVANRLTSDESYAAAHLVRRKIARLKPDDQENLLKLADLCGMLHRVSEGFEVYSRAMARRPGDALVVLRFHVFCIRQGVHSLQAGLPGEAARCFRTLTRAHPACPTAQLGLALALEALDGADNIQIDADGVGPVVDSDVSREAGKARMAAEAMGISAAATMFDVTVDALLSDLRQTIKEKEKDLADELEALLYEDGDDEPPQDDD